MINLKEEIMQLKAKIKEMEELMILVFEARNNFMEESQFIKLTVERKTLMFPTEWVEDFYVKQTDKVSNAGSLVATRISR